MTSNCQKILILVMLQVLLVKAQENNRNARDFHGYYPPEEEKKIEYQVFQYPSSYYPPSNEYEKNLVLPLLGKALSFILLKLGILSLVKAVMALVFLGFLAKLPILLVKFAFLKSFFLPFLLAPFFMQMVTNQMTQPSESDMTDKPSENSSENMNMNMNTMGMDEVSMTMGRQLTSNLSSMAWHSAKMFAESDQCVEKVSCLIGASSNEYSMGNFFSRMLKFINYSSPPTLHERVKSINEAFNKGRSTSICSDEEYKCTNPELIIQHGINKVKIF